MAVTGQTGTHAPQSIHSGGINKSHHPGVSGSFLRGWIQSPGTRPHRLCSFVLMQASGNLQVPFQTSFCPGTVLLKSRRARRKFALSDCFFVARNLKQWPDCTRHALLSTALFQIHRFEGISMRIRPALACTVQFAALRFRPRRRPPRLHDPPLIDAAGIKRLSRTIAKLVSSPSGQVGVNKASRI